MPNLGQEVKKTTAHQKEQTPLINPFYLLELNLIHSLRETFFQVLSVADDLEITNSSQLTAILQKLQQIFQELGFRVSVAAEERFPQLQGPAFPLFFHTIGKYELAASVDEYKYQYNVWMEQTETGYVIKYSKLAPKRSFPLQASIGQTVFTD